MYKRQVEEVAAEVDKKWDYILASLTTNGEELEKLAQGAQQLKDGMAQAGDFSQLTEGFEGAVQAMGQLALTHEEKAQFQQLIMAAQQPGASQETLQAAQAAMAALKLDGAITQISGQLGNAAQGVGEAQAGLQTLIEKYGELSDGLAALPDGARDVYKRQRWRFCARSREAR